VIRSRDEGKPDVLINLPFTVNARDKSEAIRKIKGLGYLVTKAEIIEEEVMRDDA